jgi:hypothetical protein
MEKISWIDHARNEEVLLQAVIPNRGSAVPQGTVEHFLGVPRDVEIKK